MDETGDGIELVLTNVLLISYRLESYYNPSGWFNTLYLYGNGAPLCVAKQGYMPIFNY